MAASAMVENRYFFMTNSQLFSIGPADCWAGNVVAVIASAETPFLLRPASANGLEDMQMPTSAINVRGGDGQGSIDLRMLSGNDDAGAMTSAANLVAAVTKNGQCITCWNVFLGCPYCHHQRTRRMDACTAP